MRNTRISPHPWQDGPDDLDGSSRPVESFDAFLAERCLEASRIVFVVLAALSFLVAVGHDTLLSPEAADIMLPIVVAACFGTILSAAAFQWWRLSPQVSRAALILAGVAGTATSVAHFALTGRGKDGISIIMLIVFVGMVMMFRAEAYGVVLGSLVGWISVAYVHDLSRLLASQGLVMFMAVAVFVVAFETRRATYRRLYKLQAELSRLALTDRLTGLGNRTAVVARISEALARSRRDPGYRFAVCFVDVNELKPINDRYGHDAGDAALRAVAEKLSSALRENDFVGRIGGDEFVALLDLTPSEAKLASAIGRIAKVLSFRMKFESQPIHVIASIGGAWSGYGYTSAEEMIEAADRAMYRDKLQHARTRTDLHALTRPPKPHADDDDGGRGTASVAPAAAHSA